MPDVCLRFEVAVKELSKKCPHVQNQNNQLWKFLNNYSEDFVRLLETMPKVKAEKKSRVHNEVARQGT